MGLFSSKKRSTTNTITTNNTENIAVAEGATLFNTDGGSVTLTDSGAIDSAFDFATSVAADTTETVSALSEAVIADAATSRLEFLGASERLTGAVIEDASLFRSELLDSTEATTDAVIADAANSRQELIGATERTINNTLEHSASALGQAFDSFANANTTESEALLNETQKTIRLLMFSAIGGLALVTAVGAFK